MMVISLISIPWIATGHLRVTPRTSNSSVSLTLLPAADAELEKRAYAIAPEGIDGKNNEKKIFDEGNHTSHTSLPTLATTVDMSSIAQIRSSSGQCLNFLHIPKNAGTTIEGFEVDGKNMLWGIILRATAS